MKIFSWNINGMRAVVRKGELQKFIDTYDPDVICFQETKAEQGQAEVDYPQYEEYWNSASKKGYSGTAIFSKIKPLAIINDIPEEFVKAGGLIADDYGQSNEEGRVIAAEFNNFYLVTAYTPNAKDGLLRIGLRQQWDKAMALYCKALEEGQINLRELSVDVGLSEVQGADEQRTEPYTRYGKGVAESATQQFAKPVIYCGDMNVAHTEDDLANPKTNKGKKGFSDEERSGFDNWLAAGFIDTFRLFKKGNGYYTWWSHFAKSRERNVGWRIDYFLVSEAIKDKIKSAEIHPDQLGSDHCPVSIEIDA